jgi:hypothetical protein
MNLANTVSPSWNAIKGCLHYGNTFIDHPLAAAESGNRSVIYIHLLRMLGGSP